MKKLNINAVCEVAISPDDTRVMTATSNLIWQWHIGTRKKVYKTHPLKCPSHLAYSPCGESLAAKNTSGEIAVLNADDGSVLKTFDDGAGEGCQIFFSRCGGFLVDGTWSGHVLVRDRHSGAIEADVSRSNAMVRRLSCSADGKAWLINWHHKGAEKPSDNAILGLAEWPLGSVKPRSIPRDLRNGCAILSPEGRRIAAVYCSELPPPILMFLEVMDVNGSTLMKVHLEKSLNAIGWSSTGQWLAVGVNGSFSFFDTQKSYQRVATVPSERPSSVAFSSDDSIVVLGDWSKGVIMSMEDVLAHGKHPAAQ